MLEPGLSLPLLASWETTLFLEWALEAQVTPGELFLFSFKAGSHKIQVSQNLTVAENDLELGVLAALGWSPGLGTC